MTIRTTSIKLVYKGEVIKFRDTTNATISRVISEWKKLYPAHLFAQCIIVEEGGKECKYGDDNEFGHLATPKEKEPTTVEKTAARMEIIKPKKISKKKIGNPSKPGKVSFPRQVRY